MPKIRECPVGHCRFGHLSLLRPSMRNKQTINEKDFDIKSFMKLLFFQNNLLK